MSGRPTVEAYWLNPKGQIIEVTDRHILVVRRTPELFGLTKRRVDAVYRRHGEPFGLEGRARLEIMTALIERGWIRVRYKPREGRWLVECSGLGVRVRRNVGRLLAHLAHLSGRGGVVVHLLARDIQTGDEIAIRRKP